MPRVSSVPIQGSSPAFRTPYRANVHQEISKFYSFKTPDGVFRDTLNGLSFEEQSAIGMDIVQRALNGTLRK